MDLYDAIVNGIKENIPTDITIEKYLESLQESVKLLRKAYRAQPVNVEYKKTKIQAAYLATYLPHYYQLIYKILLEEVPEIFQGKSKVYLTFIGGGAGSEAYGAVKYIVNNCPTVKDIHITILDINASTWSFSHNIVDSSLIDSILPANVKTHWASKYFDLTSTAEIKDNKSLIAQSDLLVIQNCLNEIALSNIARLKQNISLLFEYLPGQSYLLMSDLTSSVRATIKRIEETLTDQFHPKLVKSTLSHSSALTLQSVHHRPSTILVKHLLNGSDGLIPRKWISYDYSLLSKGVIERKFETESLGFNSIYRPLDFKKLDANDYIHKKTFIGIDFGTSSTIACIAQLEGNKIKVEPVPIRQKDHLGGSTSSALVPTIISLVNGNKLLVGKYAADFKTILEYGINSWHSFKKKLIRLDEFTYPDSSLKDNLTFKINNARDALVLFLKYFKKEVFAYLKNRGLSEDVAYSISIPAGFSSKEKQALKSCLLAAGIECEDAPFLEEPNAALINYLFENDLSAKSEDEKRILVLDLGAGTFDASIIEIGKKAGVLSSKLLSVVRLGNIGSNVIDELMAQLVVKKASLISSLKPKQYLSLIDKCEQLKIKLCKNIITDKSVEFSLPSLCVSDAVVRISATTELLVSGIDSVVISYKEFFSLMDEYWKGNKIRPGIKSTIIKSLENAGLAAESIDQVIITGGGGRNPYIKSLITDFFGFEKVVVPDNIQEHVARGVALQSFILNSFGQSIITSILSAAFFIKGINKEVLLFDIGEAIPTADKDVLIEQDISKDKRFVVSYFGEHHSNIKYFVIPENFEVEKLVFYVNPDQELKCDIVGLRKIIETEELYELPLGTLITIN